MSAVNWTKLSKMMSHALRHEPWIYELEMDDEGWVPVDDLIRALHSINEAWTTLDEFELEKLIERSEQKRHEIKDGRIRASYGHSFPGKLKRRAAVPPEMLFHGTSLSAMSRIKTTELAPMKRQFVHLSASCRNALEVGRRKAKEPVILEIRARNAWENGIRFYEGNSHVWLADTIPSAFIVFPRVAVLTQQK